MSLIPSESLNFPDSFRASVGWRLTQKVESRMTRTPQRRAVTPARSKQGESEPLREANAARQPSDPTLTSPSSLVPAPVSVAAVEVDNRQLELVPNHPLDTANSGPSSSMAEMGALLRHFFSSGVASNSPVETPNGETITFATNGIAQEPGSTLQAPAEPPPSMAETAVSPNEYALPQPVKPIPFLSEHGAEPNSVDPPQHRTEQSVPAAADPVSPEPSPVSVQTPAQAQQILELIAAAVQCGTLVGQTEPQARETSIAPEVSPPAPDTIAAPAPRVTPAIFPPSKTAITTPPKSADTARAPARIRITPRKIKPRASMPAPQPDVAVSALSDHSSGHIANDVPLVPADQEEARIPMAAQSPMSSRVPESPVSLAARPEAPSRKLPPARRHLAEADLWLFTARQRRNRWIGFGLSESAVLTALILLARFGFTHQFPDPTLKVLVFVLIFAAAAVAVALPIAFFRNDPRRWARPE
jgi:hypothetical protein